MPELIQRIPAAWRSDACRSRCDSNAVTRNAGRLNLLRLFSVFGSLSVSAQLKSTDRKTDRNMRELRRTAGNDGRGKMELASQKLNAHRRG